MAATNKKTRKTTRKKKGSEILKFTDKTGNILIAEHTAKSIYIRLFVKTEKRERNLGHIDKKTRIIFIQRSRLKHLHVKSMSYAFCYKLFKDTTRFDTVRLNDEFGSYCFPRSLVLQGDIMNFKGCEDGEDYELQYFVKLSEIKKYQTEGSF